MPRQPRFLPPDSYFHIMNRGNNQMSIFMCEEDYLFYLQKLSELKFEHPFDLFHYCLMTNHVHLLIKTQSKTDFSNFSKRLNLSYSAYYQRNYGFSGYFWQGRFKSQLIGKDSYFIQCGKYIELNPVSAGIVSLPEEYPWSSYRYYGLGERNDLITENIFYHDLGNDPKTRRKKYKELMIDDSIAERLDRKDVTVIGSKKFIYNSNRRAKYHQRNQAATYRKRPL